VTGPRDPFDPQDPQQGSGGPRPGDDGVPPIPPAPREQDATPPPPPPPPTAPTAPYPSSGTPYPGSAPSPGGSQPYPGAAPYPGANPYPGPLQTEGRTNVTAIIALILGFVVPIAGVIAGFIALGQIKRTAEKGRGLAIGGIIVGALGTLFAIIGVIALVIGLSVASQTSTDPDDVFSSAPTPAPDVSDEPGGQPSDDSTPTPEPDTQSVFDLAIGDCIIDSGGTEVFDVQTVDCAQPHDFEVYAEFDLAGTDYPGEQAVSDQGDAGCFDAFEPFVGLAYESSTLDYTFYSPTQESWTDGGDRLISCLIADPSTQVTGSLRGVAY
jgi:hypothetical protein